MPHHDIDWRYILHRVSIRDDPLSYQEMVVWGILTHPLFIQTGQTKTISCPGCHKACVESVVARPSGGMAIICHEPEDYGTIPVDHHEMSLWGFDWDTFIASLCEALQWQHPVTRYENRLWLVGNIRDKPLLLLKAAAHPDTATIIARYTQGLHAPVILTLDEPNNRHEPIQHPTLPLHTFITIDTKGHINCNASLLHNYIPLTQEKPVQYCFQKQGDQWRIVYEGKESYVKHTKGMTYLNTLLHNPNTPFHTSILQSQAAPALQQQVFKGHANALELQEAIDTLTDFFSVLIEIESERRKQHPTKDCKGGDHASH